MRFVIASSLIGTCVMTATTSLAQVADPWDRPQLSYRGGAGMIDMPTAHAFHDGDLSFSAATFGSDFRTAFTFQIAPRLSGTFRYAGIYGYTSEGGPFYDRSFDVQYLLSEETRKLPAIAVGIQDIGGTGIFSSEYVVATKTYGRLRGTLGLGWGRFASRGGFQNPLGLLASQFKTRPVRAGGLEDTGRIRGNTWFRGDAAFFGGIQYAYSDRLMLTAEYSSDAYLEEISRTGHKVNSPINLGLTYQFKNGLNLNTSYINGSTLGVQLSYSTNPMKSRTAPNKADKAPPALVLRNPGDQRDLGWTEQSNAPVILRQNTHKIFEQNKLNLTGFEVYPTRVVVRFRNPTYRNQAQAIGRAARILTSLMPASVETFVLVSETSVGHTPSSVTIRRSDLEDLEFAPDGTWQSYARAKVAPSQRAIRTVPESIPSFTWNVSPYVGSSYFDPNSPVRLDIGVQANARYEPTPGLVFKGRVKQRLAGNFSSQRPSNSVIQRVRSDANLYSQNGDLTIPELTGSYFFRPGENLYGRVTVGYLERMYGGISAELLWKPVDSRLAFGSELNYVAQRDFDQRFGFQSYDVLTGHVSAYYDTGTGYQFQLDAGRYLAKDWGATFGVDREFDNGVSVGAFATLTDVSFEDFGEGSFDKGIRISVPFALLSGRQNTKSSLSRTIRPVSRDGGARVRVADRLYQPVRELHSPKLKSSWGKFWK